jgi:hypothetical protein
MATNEFEVKISADLDAGVIRYEVPTEQYKATAEQEAAQKNAGIGVVRNVLVTVRAANLPDLEPLALLCSRI